MKTKTEILDAVVAHFATHRRGLDEDGTGCTYMGENGDRCAHSIFLTDEGLHSIINGGHHSSIAADVIKLFGDEIHQEDYRGHDELFWTDVQVLHDSPCHWDKKEDSIAGNTLTDEGERTLERLKTKWMIVEVLKEEHEGEDVNEDEEEYAGEIMDEVLEEEEQFA